MSPSVKDVETAFRGVLASPYLSDMSQYGFEQLESLEFAFVNGGCRRPTSSSFNQKFSGIPARAIDWSASCAMRIVHAGCGGNRWCRCPSRRSRL
jgi:hypothetical protein